MQYVSLLLNDHLSYSEYAHELIVSFLTNGRELIRKTNMNEEKTTIVYGQNTHRLGLASWRFFLCLLFCARIATDERTAPAAFIHSANTSKKIRSQ